MVSVLMQVARGDRCGWWSRWRLASVPHLVRASNFTALQPLSVTCNSALQRLELAERTSFISAFTLKSLIAKIRVGANDASLLHGQCQSKAYICALGRDTVCRLSQQP
jgi:hypothetical protein